MDPLYGTVVREHGRFRLRRRFIPLRDGNAFPTNSNEITVLDDSGAELAVVWLPRPSDPADVVQCLKQWLPGEASRLVHLEIDVRRQRRVVEAEGGQTPLSPGEWTSEQWQAYYERQEERARAMWSKFEPTLREHGFSPERTREYVERVIQEVGEEPDSNAKVVQWWQLGLDERYQRYELVERGLYELKDVHPEIDDSPSH